MAKQHQIVLYGSQLRKVRAELEKRDLSDVATEKLLNMELKILEAVNKSDISIVFRSNDWLIDTVSHTWDG